MSTSNLDPVLYELLTKGQEAAARGLLIGSVSLNALGVLVATWAALQSPINPVKVAYSVPFFLLALLAFAGWRQARHPLKTKAALLVSTGQGLARAFLREDRIKAQGARVGTLLTLVLVRDNGQEVPINVPKTQGEAIMQAMRRQHPSLPLEAQ
ncbi:MAG: hypothetical protein ACI9VR_001396 [Cognaticolwellia sp.]